MTVIYRVHAVRRMFERGIAETDVQKVLSEGEDVAAERILTTCAD